MSVHVSGGTLGGTFTHSHIGTYQRFTLKLAVHHGTCDGTFLRHHHNSGEEEEEENR